MDAIPDVRRDVLVSIRPRYASKILDGEKTVELQKEISGGWRGRDDRPYLFI